MDHNLFQTCKIYFVNPTAYNAEVAKRYTETKVEDQMAWSKKVQRHNINLNIVC